MFFQLITHAKLDQSLNTTADSLSNFNRKIANKYKAGLGLKYLDHFLEDAVISTTIKDFYTTQNLKFVSGQDFISILKSKSTKKILIGLKIIISKPIKNRLHT